MQTVKNICKIYDKKGLNIVLIYRILEIQKQNHTMIPLKI